MSNDLLPRRATPLLLADLDGTVRKGKEQTGYYVNEPGDVEVFDESVTMLRRWRMAGGRIVGVSNQGGISLGFTTNARVLACMSETRRQAQEMFDGMYWCPHHPDAGLPEQDSLTDHCACRKPYPGLVYHAIQFLMSRYNEVYPVSRMLVVGDMDADEGLAGNLGAPFRWAHEWRALARLPRLENTPDPLGVMPAETYEKMLVDLGDMAATRRRAEAEAAGIVLP